MSKPIEVARTLAKDADHETPKFSEYILVDQTNGNPKCKKCQFEVKAGKEKTSQLHRHIATYHLPVIEPYQCCDESFETKWDLFIHLIENHRDEKHFFDKFRLGFNIEYLEKLISEKTLEVEVIQETSSDPTICWECPKPKSFENHLQYLTHLQTHMPIKSEN